jgi:hypothetical protein
MVSSHRNRADRAANEALTVACFGRDRFAVEGAGWRPNGFLRESRIEIVRQDDENFGRDLIGAERDLAYFPPAPLAWPLSVPAWSIADLK